jgi:hypothetical protein
MLSFMRAAIAILLVTLFTGCETVQTAHDRIPKQTPTQIVFNTTDLLYTEGLGEAGVDGFCKRIETYVARDLKNIGIDAIPQPQAGAATIRVTLSTIESKGGIAFNPLFGAYGTPKVRAIYSATLESPDGKILAAWKHDVDEDSPDKLASHMASDIVKYLKVGFQ